LNGDILYEFEVNDTGVSKLRVRNIPHKD